jgi:hypothetical protein
MANWQVNATRNISPYSCLFCRPRNYADFARRISKFTVHRDEKVKETLAQYEKKSLLIFFSSRIYLARALAILYIFWQRFLPISWQELETRSVFALQS